MRPKQWVKNSFVLAPLLFSGEFTELSSIGHGVVAMILFCLVSSAVYIINDMCDVAKDRQHPVKSVTRPLAAGVIPVWQAALLLGLIFAAVARGWLLLPNLILPTGLYLALGLAYSFSLKHQPVLDIFAVAAGFVLRVYAGSVALSVPLSDWMFITTLCLALYLASIKRRQELSQRGTGSRDVLHAYTVGLTDRFAEMSAIGAILFYSLYVMSAKPELIITIPMVLFGLFRYWYAVEVLGRGESPTDALFEDWHLVSVIVVWIGTCVWLLWPAAL
jgi:4-hydroxybenzoate polyprenyltransferase